MLMPLLLWEAGREASGRLAAAAVPLLLFGAAVS